VIEARSPDAVWRPFGAFSLVAVERGGRIVDLKGRVALDPAGQVVGVGDMAAQVRQSLDDIPCSPASAARWRTSSR
jgi:enamine deaminase RidA (YjgF/YER057c/UK114 family)